MVSNAGGSLHAESGGEEEALTMSTPAHQNESIHFSTYNLLLLIILHLF